MFKFEKTIFINRPQQEVFDFVSEPANDEKWQDSVETSEWVSEGPAAVGSKVRSVNKFLGRKIEATSEITVWEPPNRVAQKSVGGPIPFEVSIKLESKENGTELTVVGEAEFGGFFKLAEGLVGKQFEKQLDGDIEKLKQVMEG